MGLEVFRSVQERLARRLLIQQIGALDFGIFTESSWATKQRKRFFFYREGGFAMNTSIARNRLREFLPTQWGEFDSLLDQVFGPNGLRTSRALYAPASIWEDDGSYHVELDVPGVVRDNIELTFDKGALLITAERKRPEQDRPGWHEGRAYGKVTRRLMLPESIDPDCIKAELNDGVLRVSVAKTPESQPKRIDVK